MQNNIPSTPAISYRNFNLVVIGQIISILGSALLRFALSFYILDITGRADLYATLYAVSNIAILISPIGGAIADRFNRRNLMVLYDFTSSAIVFLYCMSLASHHSSVLMTGAVMVMLSLISAMYQPTVTASIPLLVEETRLEQANGMVNGVQALSNVAAPIVGGMVYGMIGVGPLVLISAIAFFSSAILELFIHIPFEKRKTSMSMTGTLVKDIKSGFLYMRKNPIIMKSSVLAALLNMILTPLFVVGGPVILKIVMHSSDIMYGIGMGTINFATILGAFLIGLVAAKMSMKRLYGWLLGIAVLIVPMALSVAPPVIRMGFRSSFTLFLVCAVPIAMIMTTISIFVVTKVQRETPNEYLGKVMATITAVSQCAAPVGQLVYGIIFQKFQTALYLPVLLVSIAMFVLSLVTRHLFSKSEVAVC